MKKAAVSKLSDPIWFKPIDGDPLDVQIVPAAAGEVDNFIPAMRDQVVDRVCRKAFVGFRGYLDDDGSELPNTYAHRVELFNVAAVANAVILKLRELNAEAAMGEESAVSV